MSINHSFRLPFSSAPVQIAGFAPRDHEQALLELERASRKHLHLDWLSLPELLTSPDLRCRVIRQGYRLRALIGATVHRHAHTPGGVAWLRVILPGPSTRTDLDQLWEALRGDLLHEGITRAGILMMESWMETFAKRWGFEQANAVVTLRRTDGPMPAAPQPPLQVRNVRADDLDQVTDTDAASFETFWHHDRATLEAAWRHAATFTVLQRNGDILGYQLSTWHIETGHLARLAIHPDHQGEGLGGVLVGEMLRFFAGRGVSTFTVNTQTDNLASQRLYRRLGFQPTGHSVAFWATDLR